MDMCINVFYMFLPIVYLAYKKHNYLYFSILLLLRLLIIQPSVPKTLISHESSFVFPPLYFKFILMQLYYIKSAFTSKHCYKCFFLYILVEVFFDLGKAIKCIQGRLKVLRSELTRYV